MRHNLLQKCTIYTVNMDLQIYHISFNLYVRWWFTSINTIREGVELFKCIKRVGIYSSK